MIKTILAALAFLMGTAFGGMAIAQGFGELAVCTGDDPKCQTPGTVALSCLSAHVEDVSRWRDTGDALRVNNGRWQMFYASSDQVHNCANVLVYRGSGQGWGAGLRYCAGDDRNCQTPGQVAYACFLDAQAAGQPTLYQYTGDAIRVSGNRWQIWYSHNQQSYACAAVLVGGVPYGGGFGGQPRLCAGNDPACQAPGTIPLLCDINGDGFASPESYAYTGRSMRVSGGHWQMQYPSQQIYTCKSVIVAASSYAPPSAPPVQPTPPTAAGGLPPGSVILFDAAQCPAGWARIGQVIHPGSPVSGMSYCRRQ